MIMRLARLTILLGDGKGNLKRTRIRDACDGPLSIAAGDIDRDGNLDLAVSGLLDSICLYYGDGKLGFTETQIDMHPFTAPFTDVTITNVDGDQFPDLLVAAQSGNVIFIIGTKEGGNSLVPVVGHRIDSSIFNCCWRFGQQWNIGYSDNSGFWKCNQFILLWSQRLL